MTQKQGQSHVSRRTFLNYVVGGIGGLIAAAIAVPLVSYFLAPAFKKNTPLLTPIGRAEDIPKGKPTFITYEQRIRDGWYVTTLSKGAWVLTMDGKEFTVYDPKCTHLNCPFYWDDQKKEFFCPCHGGRFDIDGNVVGGPPPRPLDRLAVEIQQGNILIGGSPKGKG
jgi:menaquinol-cytochrome c reductase iron-sulfur subunit